MKLPAEKVNRLRGFYEGRDVCVTGGAGFIGGHLVDALLGCGANVAVIDDLSSSSLEHLAGLIELEPDRLRFTHGSILDDEALAEAVRGSRTVFHLAAVGSVPRSLEEPERAWNVNATGTLRVLESARESRRVLGDGGVERIILAASSSAYGDDGHLPRIETATPRPVSPYGASKVAAEHLMSVWARSFGLSTACLRYFNVFGPRQPADTQYAGVIAAFAKRLLAGESPVILGDGRQTRDFTFVADAVLATLLAGASPHQFAGEVMNIGTGRAISITDLAKLMAERLGAAHLEPEYASPRPGDARDSLADISRARELLGYEPMSSLATGMDETLEWYRQTLAGA
jgi:nucleoside-diphosphate-sugar epimerase